MADIELNKRQFFLIMIGIDQQCHNGIIYINKCYLKILVIDLEILDKNNY